VASGVVLLLARLWRLLRLLVIVRVVLLVALRSVVGVVGTLLSVRVLVLVWGLVTVRAGRRGVLVVAQRLPLGVASIVVVAVGHGRVGEYERRGRQASVRVGGFEESESEMRSRPA
jgi:hypothetical protein